MPVQSLNKHIVYLACATLLGILLSFLAHAGIEMAYLSWADSHNVTIHWYNGCSLHPAFQIGLVIAGVIGGFFLGRWWWRMVYVERRWRKKQSGVRGK